MPDGTSFGSAAGDYEAGRPGYPADAVAWMVPASARRVVDVGAGTGKLTRALTAPGRKVVAVDPDPAMLATLESTLPGVQTLVGTAEALPLPDASYDAVVFGQAWHWVDASIAVPEVARVLAPGGTLGLVWNIRDDREPWVAAMTEIIGLAPADEFIRSNDVGVGEPFSEVERATIRWTATTTVDGLVALVRSRSVSITGGDRATDMVVDLISLLATHPQTRDRTSFDLPYVTHMFRATLG
jgi:SAM-dependent methyltransferase